MKRSTERQVKYSSTKTLSLASPFLFFNLHPSSELCNNNRRYGLKSSKNGSTFRPTNSTYFQVHFRFLLEMDEKTGNDKYLEKTENFPQVGSLLQWSQWQLLDSILPTGGFAHSFGLEAAIQARLVSGPQDLQDYVIHVLDNAGSLLLPFVYSATISPDMETWHKLDRMLDATLTNEVGRKASMLQGSALMRVAAAVYLEIPSLKPMRSASLSSGAVSFHHAPIFGLVCGLLGIDAETSQKAYMFITMRDVISAATRLNLVGPLGAAVLQHQVSAVAEDLSKKWMNRAVEEACQTSPLLDTIQGCHDYLFSRLFCS